MVPTVGNFRRDTGKFGETFAHIGMATPSRAGGAPPEGVETSGGVLAPLMTAQTPVTLTAGAAGEDIVHGARKRAQT